MQIQLMVFLYYTRNVQLQVKSMVAKTSTDLAKRKVGPEFRPKDLVCVGSGQSQHCSLVNFKITWPQPNEANNQQ